MAPQRASTNFAMLVLKYTLPTGAQKTQPIATVRAAAHFVVRSEAFQWGYTDISVVTEDGNPACTAEEWAAELAEARGHGKP